MSIFIHSSGETKSVINGNVVDDKSFDASYNGKNMKIIGHDKDKNFNVKMTNDDIMELLTKPSSSLTLKERLMNDYNINNRTVSTFTKKRINKSTRKKRTINKSTRKKSTINKSNRKRKMN